MDNGQLSVIPIVGTGVLLRYPASSLPRTAALSADRGHSLRSLLPPPAALPSLPSTVRPHSPVIAPQAPHSCHPERSVAQSKDLGTLDQRKARRSLDFARDDNRLIPSRRGDHRSPAIPIVAAGDTITVNCQLSTDNCPFRTHITSPSPAATAAFACRATRTDPGDTDTPHRDRCPDTASPDGAARSMYRRC